MSGSGLYQVRFYVH